MSAAAFDEQAAQWARELEDQEARRLGILVQDARKRVARSCGVPAGTLENLRRGRLKGVRAWVWAALRNAWEVDRQRQLKALAHELEITRALVGTDHPAVRAVEALVDARSDRPVQAMVGEGAQE